LKAAGDAVRQIKVISEEAITGLNAMTFMSLLDVSINEIET
jgi:hypothetical protein